MDITSIISAIAYAYSVALDPEPTASLYWDVAPKKLRQAVKETQKRFPGEESCEWWEDFLAAHRWLEDNPNHPEAKELLARALMNNIIRRYNGVEATVTLEETFSDSAHPDNQYCYVLRTAFIDGSEAYTGYMDRTTALVDFKIVVNGYKGELDI